MTSSLAAKYARALLDAVSEAGREAATHDELTAFERLLSEYEELRDTLENPAIPFSAKRRIIEVLAERVPLSPSVRNFLLVVLENGRMAHFAKIVAAYQLVWDERRGVVRGRVSSARELERDARRRLESEIRRLTRQEVKLQYDSDSDLIGGVKLQVGSTIFDGSIQTQLREIGRRLAGK